MTRTDVEIKKYRRSHAIKLATEIIVTYSVLVAFIVVLFSC